MAREWFFCLTDEIRDEAIGNYLAERHLLALQVENLEEQERDVRNCASETGKRLSRLACWTISSEMLERLIGFLNIPPRSPWHEYVERRSSRVLQTLPIHVYGLTDKAKFKKILWEAYRRLHHWMGKYRFAHEQLEAECRGININIEGFHKNHNVLAVLSFIRNLDIRGLEKSRLLGGNFTCDEMNAVGERLRFYLYSSEKLHVVAPLVLPEPDSMKGPLKDLARDIYDRYRMDVKQLLTCDAK